MIRNDSKQLSTFQVLLELVLFVSITTVTIFAVTKQVLYVGAQWAIAAMNRDWSKTVQIIAFATPFVTLVFIACLLMAWCMSKRPYGSDGLSVSYAICCGLAIIATTTLFVLTGNTGVWLALIVLLSFSFVCHAAVYIAMYRE